MAQSVSDACNKTLGLGAIEIEKVTSDEPDNAPGDADGNTTNDIVIGPIAIRCSCAPNATRRTTGGCMSSRCGCVMRREHDAPGLQGERAHCGQRRGAAEHTAGADQG